MIKLWTALMLAALPGASAAHAGEITAAGKRLSLFLDGMHVEQLWLSGQQVDWRSGEPNGRVFETAKGHTHCSAFAAAVAERLGIYLLHPPEHSAMLLANAQQDWLNAGGANRGWHRVGTPLEAQELANEGQLVLVTFKNPDPETPGHVAIVRPSAKSREQIEAEGPDIIQAGLHNHIRTSVKEGFKSHPGAFEKREVQYFAHAVVAFSAPAQSEAGAAQTSRP
ncbi:MAG TPA: hypothetical protein VK731_12300 [Candidatus Cybelea sp.]|nr:hypothetical protein [Candidatus Cybelea sp.]